MTRTQRAFYRRRHLLWAVAVVLVLSGAIGVVWLLGERRADEADARAAEVAAGAERLAAEADRRGDAVSTLATDVRQLRAQLQAEGEKPVAPDPERAVDDLGDRAEVPVPIPGPRGPRGAEGPPGKPAPTITPRPGASGAPGADGKPGADSTVPGPSGPPGADSTIPGPQGAEGPRGPQGERGEQGEPGPACPDGYSLQAPAWDPYALMCRADGAPPPEDPGPTAPGPQAAVDPQRRRP